MTDRSSTSIVLLLAARWRCILQYELVSGKLILDGDSGSISNATYNFPDEAWVEYEESSHKQLVVPKQNAMPGAWSAKFFNSTSSFATSSYCQSHFVLEPCTIHNEVLEKVNVYPYLQRSRRVGG
jgi:hypothetical protein